MFCSEGKRKKKNKRKEGRNKEEKKKKTTKKLAFYLIGTVCSCYFVTQSFFNPRKNEPFNPA